MILILQGYIIEFLKETAFMFIVDMDWLVTQVVLLKIRKIKINI